MAAVERGRSMGIGEEEEAAAMAVAREHFGMETERARAPLHLFSLEHGKSL